MTIKNGRKFTEEFKKIVKDIYESLGLEACLQFVRKDHPKTTERTIKSWVDEECQSRIKNTRKKSYEKVKSENPEKLSKWQNMSYQNNKKERQTNPELRKRRVEYSASWAKKNKERIRELDHKYWHEGNAKQKRYEYIKKRKQTDLNFHIRENLRSRVHGLLKKAICDPSTINENIVELISCSLDFLANHLRSQYKPGMTDENYGQWHIDHIKPCCLFNLTLLEQRRECFHYTNLQPLWAAENLAKGNKYQKD